MKKEAKRKKENLNNQEPPGKIVYICFNDWDDEFESEKCKDFLLSPKKERYPFEWEVGNYDMAAVFLITTTEEDLREYGYEEFLKYRIDPAKDEWGIWTIADFFHEEYREFPFPPYKNPKFKNVEEN